MVHYLPEMPAQPSVEEAHEAITCLQRLSDAFVLRRRQLAQGVGLTEHQWEVLEEISTEHFMPSMFAKVRHSSRAAVSKTLRSLLDKKLVRVSVSPDDGRQRRYCLTSRGARIIERIRGQREAAVTRIWLRLPRRRLELFTCIGNELTARLSAYARDTSEE
jgi:DNA-binding MarR family transcriptional regulator